jgi:hypothetical protein
MRHGVRGKPKADEPGTAPDIKALKRWARRRKDWTISEVIDLATQAVGNGIKWLEARRPDHRIQRGISRGDTTLSESYVLAGQLLTEYVGAATKIGKEVRETLAARHLKDVHDSDLVVLLVAEMKRDRALAEKVQAAWSEAVH